MPYVETLVAKKLTVTYEQPHYLVKFKLFSVHTSEELIMHFN